MYESSITFPRFSLSRSVSFLVRAYETHMAGSSIAAGKGSTLINVRFTVISEVASRTHTCVPIHAVLEKEERRLPTGQREEQRLQRTMQVAPFWQ